MNSATPEIAEYFFLNKIHLQLISYILDTLQQLWLYFKNIFFQNLCAIGTGLTDYHKKLLKLWKWNFKKLKHRIVHYSLSMMHLESICYLNSQWKLLVLLSIIFKGFLEHAFVLWTGLFQAIKNLFGEITCLLLIEILRSKKSIMK